MKAQAAISIIIIIIIAVAAIIILPRLGINFVVPGGGNVPISTVKYSNNVISIDEFSISDRSPFSGKNIDTTGSVTIMFSVTNNGDKDFDNSKPDGNKNLEVEFTDLPNIAEMKLVCPDGTEVKSPRFVCEITKLESFDSKRITAEMKVKTGIKDEIQISQIKYSVSYRMVGGVEARIPIVEDPLFLPQGAKFQAGTPTYGPIQVSIKPPVGRERKVAGQTVIDNFAYKNSPFNLELRVSDVGSLVKEQVKFEKAEEKLEIKLENLQTVFCDKMTKNEAGDVTTLVKEPEQKVPFDIVCNIKSALNEQTRDQNYFIGSVSVNYNYDYKLTGSETLTIRPFNPIS